MTNGSPIEWFDASQTLPPDHEYVLVAAKPSINGPRKIALAYYHPSAKTWIPWNLHVDSWAYLPELPPVPGETAKGVSCK